MDLQSLTDTQVRLLACSRNRAILEHLEVAGPLPVRELATRLVDDDVDVVSQATYEERLESVGIDLHHHRLPKLAEAGLLEYDTETETVAATHSGDEPDRVPLLEALAGDQSEDVRLLQGRGRILQHGRWLADQATDEVFCMYVSPDLLEDACIEHARRAIDRGVQFTIGTHDGAVRTLVREALPGATVWEPQRDLLSTEAVPRLGRLVLTDRELVMLSILEEEGPTPDETALVGEGSANPLVVLVRDLLGPRIDHLDYQSEAFRSELPP